MGGHGLDKRRMVLKTYLCHNTAKVCPFRDIVWLEMVMTASDKKC